MSGGNSVYSPLPQSNSDSNGSSEEELHVPHESRTVKRVLKNTKTDKTFNGQKQNIINYKPLDTDGDIGVTLIRFQSNSDEISIMKTSKNLEMFSTMRKIFFVLSLLLCIFTTIAFIWILPCNVESCLSVNKTSNFINWNKTLPVLEIYGPISLVPDTSGKTQSIVFLISNLGSEQNFTKGGLITFKGNNGEVSWRISFNKKADDIDCTLIDVNLDGYNDCLVIGSGFLKAVHSLFGNELWDTYNSSREAELHELDFPLVIPDLNGDGVRDLLTSCSFAKRNSEGNFSSFGLQNNLVIISGRTGSIVNNPLQINSCSAIHNLMFENSSVVSYTCHVNNSTGKESLQTISLLKVYNTLKYNTAKQVNSYNWEIFRRQEENQNVIRVNGRRFTLENQGHCPEDCIAVLDVRDERQGRNNKTIYANQYKNTFGMSPAVIKSKKATGFVLKLWKWLPGDKVRKRNNKLKKSVILDREMFLESDTQITRFKKAATFHKTNTNSTDLNLRVIKETIVRIGFNESHSFANNLTEDEVFQVCRKGRPCQPEVNRQRRSVLVADLNLDGKEELVAYTSKYVHEVVRSKESNNWQLQSRVLVISL